MFTMRFDMRAPDFGAPAAELYAAALDMSEWAETRGCLTAIVCEHHASPDGYLPAPTLLTSAIVARTTSLPVMIGALLLPLHDPVRLAEEMSVLDIMSRGRVSYVLGIGYRPEEFESYGRDIHRRGRTADEMLPILLKAKTGEPFEHEGRRVHATPAPFTPGGPMVSIGGGSVIAARRAGRHGVGLIAQRSAPELQEAYEQASREAGFEPGLCIMYPADLPYSVFVADDVDRAWDELGLYLLHDAQLYGAWNAGSAGTASLSFAQTVEELRAEQGSHRVLTVQEAVGFVRAGMPLSLHPLVGGLPPEIAWRYLRTVTDEVMPALQGSTDP